MYADALNAQEHYIVKNLAPDNTTLILEETPIINELECSMQDAQRIFQFFLRSQVSVIPEGTMNQFPFRLIVNNNQSYINFYGVVLRVEEVAVKLNNIFKENWPREPFSISTTFVKIDEENHLVISIFHRPSQIVAVRI